MLCNNQRFLKDNISQSNPRPIATLKAAIFEKMKTITHAHKLTKKLYAAFNIAFNWTTGACTIEPHLIFLVHVWDLTVANPKIKIFWSFDICNFYYSIICGPWFLTDYFISKIVKPRFIVWFLFLCVSLWRVAYSVSIKTDCRHPFI